MNNTWKIAREILDALKEERKKKPKDREELIMVIDIINQEIFNSNKEGFIQGYNYAIKGN